MRIRPVSQHASPPPKSLGGGHHAAACLSFPFAKSALGARLALEELPCINSPFFQGAERPPLVFPACLWWVGPIPSAPASKTPLPIPREMDPALTQHPGEQDRLSQPRAGGRTEEFQPPGAPRGMSTCLHPSTASLDHEARVTPMPPPARQREIPRLFTALFPIYI